MILRLLPVLAGMAGCAYISDEDEAVRLDPDGDGVPIGQDCDDTDAAVGAPVTWFVDEDGDNYGLDGTETTGCEVPDLAAVQAGDCDDTDSSVFPGATDTWYDGIDSDCAGDNDFDQDGDGYDRDTDCDDTDPSLAPTGEPEIYFNGEDDNCDLTDGDGDQDGDGFWAWDYVNRCNGNSEAPMDIPEGKAGDCWDDPTTTRDGFDAINGFESPTADAVHPGAAEVWYDGVDTDCGGEDANGDGIPDDFDWDLDGASSSLWPDRDGGTGEDCLDCDCVDGDCPASCDGEIDNPGGVDPAAVNPDAVETWYDGTDQDCAGDDDLDRDRDGVECDSSYGGLCAGDDCNDESATAYPGAPDTWYDGEDSDCGGEDDFDQDGDSYASEVYGGTDCDDIDPTINPAATEIWYDNVDSDCADDDDFDQDGDGYQSEVEASRGTDCDDTNPLVNPGAAEVEGNGIDDDCSGDTNGNALEGSLDLSDADGLWVGLSSGDNTGEFVSPAGDVNGDGFDDFIVGSDNPDQLYTNAGIAFVVHGPGTSGGSLAGAAAILNGDEASAYAGLAAAPLGDLNGDGYDDVAFGAYGADVSATTDGGVYVFLGPVTTTGMTSRMGDEADSIFYGGEDGAAAGRFLTAIGDQDGDGEAELLVGAPYDSRNTTYAGSAWIVTSSLTAGGALDSSGHTISPEGSFYELVGWSGADGDFDGDGQADVVIGAAYSSESGIGNAGAAYLIDGPVTGDLTLGTSTATRIEGAEQNEGLGAGVSAGDLNDDGYDDLILGASGKDNGASTDAGAVYILEGPITAGGSAALLASGTIYGPTSAHLGLHIEASSDLNDDGVQDLVVSAPDASTRNSEAGAVYLFLETSTGSALAESTATARLSGSSIDQSVIGTVAGDVDGDSYPDILLGVPGYSATSTGDQGGAAIFLGGAL